MSGQIFISYRRDDAKHPAGRLHDHLSRHFPHTQIFRDVDNISPGIDFVEAIEKSVGGCDVLIAVIGKSWLASADEQGKRRLDNPKDFVRTEIGMALKREIRVIPVLVDGASMPAEAKLPDDLKPLLRRQALPVSDERFEADSEPLIRAAKQVLWNAQARKLKKLWWVAVVIVGCWLGFGLFKATRPQPVSIGGSSSPTPVPLAAASNPPSPTPSVRQASPSPTPSGADPLAEAKQYLAVEKYPQALPPLGQAAAAGNAEAMYRLAELYYRGNGVARNYAQASELYLNAARAGYPEAMYDYAYMLENGEGMAQDHVQARQWFQKAAGAGNAEAKQALSQLPSR